MATFFGNEEVILKYPPHTSPVPIGENIKITPFDFRVEVTHPNPLTFPRNIFAVYSSTHSSLPLQVDLRRSLDNEFLVMRVEEAMKRTCYTTDELLALRGSKLQLILERKLLDDAKENQVLGKRCLLDPPSPSWAC